MEKPLDMVEQVASSSAREDEIDKQLFQQFTLKNPIWDFHSLTREQYLALSKEKKVELMKYICKYVFNCSFRRGYSF